MEIIKNFGLDPYLTVAQIVNFLIILYVLRRFLYKPLFKIFEKREQLAKEGLKNAEESKKALEEARKEEKVIIKNAQITASQILKDAREQSLEAIAQSHEAAKKQTDRMIQDARTQIAQETGIAEAQLSKYISRLSIDFLRKSLTDVFSSESQDEIVKKAVKAVQRKSN